MPFEGLKQTTTNEQIKTPITVDNSDKGPKYAKPELQNFHEDIVKKYEKTDNKTLQKVLETLDKDIGENLLSQGFDVIKDLLNNDPNFLTGENNEIQINGFIKIIKDEINIRIKIKQVEDKTEQVEDKTEQVENKTEQVENKTEQAKEKRAKISNLYQGTPEENKKIDSKDFEKFTTKNAKKIEEIQKILPEGITINDYVKNRFTAIQLSQDNKAPIANKTEFINQFNSFNKLLDIDIEIPLVAEKVEVKSAEEKTSTMSEIAADDEQILAVPSIKAYVQSSKDLISDSNFEKMDIDDEQILKIYSQEDREKTINAAIRDEGKDIDITKYFTDGKLDEDELKQDVDEDTYATITSIVNQVNKELVKSGKDKIKEETNTIMKETIMTNVFKGLTGYFTTTNGRVENFADDFELDMEENKDNIDPNNKIIKLNGTINGCLTGFYYNTKTGELQMDDIVNFDERLYKVGKKNSGEKLTLPTKLPTVKEMRETAKNTDIKDILEQSDDLEGYKENLKADLDSTLSKNFSHTELNKYYIERYNEENIAMQENLGYIFDNLGGAINENLVDFEGNQEFAIETKPNQYKLFHIMDKSVKHYKDSGEYLQLRAEFERFNANINTEEIQDPTIGCQEPLIQKLFNEDAMAESGNNRKTGGSEEAKINYTTLYDILSDETTGVIDLKALQTINDIIEKDETIEQHETEFSNNIISKYEARKADFDIDEELSGM